MTKFLSVIDGVLKPYYNRILYIFLFITFSVVVYYAYKKYYVSQRSGFTDVANANRNNKVVTVYMFHVDWCPHCKKALPEWELFKNKYDGKEMNGYTIEAVDIDCTNETSDVTTALNKFKIEKLRVYASAMNMLTITKYPYWDPEVNSDSFDSNIAKGNDFYTPPQPKTILLGVNINF